MLSNVIHEFSLFSQSLQMDRGERRTFQGHLNGCHCFDAEGILCVLQISELQGNTSPIFIKQCEMQQQVHYTQKLQNIILYVSRGRFTKIMTACFTHCISISQSLLTRTDVHRIIAEGHIASKITLWDPVSTEIVYCELCKAGIYGRTATEQ